MKTLSIFLAMSLCFGIMTTETESPGYIRSAAKRLGQSEFFTQLSLMVRGCG